jgi:hypothetical protein
MLHCTATSFGTAVRGPSPPFFPPALPQTSWVRVTGCDNTPVSVPPFEGSGFSTKRACPEARPGRLMSVLSAFCHCGGLAPGSLTPDAGAWGGTSDGFGGGIMLFDEGGSPCAEGPGVRCVAAECRTDDKNLGRRRLQATATACECASLTLYCTDEAP